MWYPDTTNTRQSRAVEWSVLCRFWPELSNEYLVAKIGFNTAESEPCNLSLPPLRVKIINVPPRGFLICIYFLHPQRPRRPEDLMIEKSRSLVFPVEHWKSIRFGNSYWTLCFLVSSSCNEKLPWERCSRTRSSSARWTLVARAGSAGARHTT